MHPNNRVLFYWGEAQEDIRVLQLICSVEQENQHHSLTESLYFK